MTPDQATRFGATAGEPADPCSHAPCDSIDNVDIETLTEMTRAAAAVVAELASD